MGALSEERNKKTAGQKEVDGPFLTMDETSFARASPSFPRAA